MKKKGLLFLLIFGLSLPAVNWCPWWISAVVGMAGILFLQRGHSKSSFLLAGLAGGLAWLTMTIWKDEANNQILSTKMAMLFHLPSPYLFWLLEGLIGFVTTGLGAWVSNSFKQKGKPKVAIDIPEE